MMMWPVSFKHSLSLSICSLNCCGVIKVDVEFVVGCDGACVSVGGRGSDGAIEKSKKISLPSSCSCCE